MGAVVAGWEEAVVVGAPKPVNGVVAGAAVVVAG